MSEIKVDTLTGKTTANDITVTVGASATMSLEQGLAKAWVNFDGMTATIRDDLNVSTLIDSATGEFNVNYTNNMSNVNYSVQVTSSFGGTDVGGADDSDYLNGIGTLRRTSGSTSTTATKIITASDVSTNTQDHAQSMVLVHGDLA